MMKNFLFVVVVAACGSKQQAPVSNAGGSADTAPVKDTRTEIERRRDTACESLGPRITQCAVEDAKKALAAGKVKKEQFDKDTAQGVLDKNTSEFITKCKEPQYSSRQVRVLEVCPKEETECGPLLSCLENLNKK